MLTTIFSMPHKNGEGFITSHNLLQAAAADVRMAADRICELRCSGSVITAKTNNYSAEQHADTH